MSIEAVLKL